jgi:hypothetical protein
MFALCHPGALCETPGMPTIDNDCPLRTRPARLA